MARDEDGENPVSIGVGQKGGRLFKARVIGGPVTEEELKRQAESKQILEDPFAGISGYGGAVRQPPFSFEQLVILAESHPVHGAALEQKAVDAVGAGPKLVPIGDEADEKQRDEIQKWIDDLTDEVTLTEVLNSVWLDFETIGWGMFEVARDSVGKVRKIFHIPGHTVRAHQDKKRVVQIRQGRQAWLKRWGSDTDVDAPILIANGRGAPAGTSPEKIANEAVIFVKPSRRSSWYGIPNYVSALGHITLAVAARDYNVHFFTNAREPRLIFIVSGIDEEGLDDSLDDLEQSLRTQHREPHRNLILPVTAGGTVKIERITAIQNDLHFTKLMEVTERAILIAHRMPPDRVGAVMRGTLGGNAAQSINQVYKDAVVRPAKMIVVTRLNRFMRKEYARFAEIDENQIGWEMELEDLDLSDEALDTEITVVRVKTDLITLNEGRRALGMEDKDEFGEMTLSEWLVSHGGGSTMAMAATDHAPRIDAMARTQEAFVGHLEELDDLLQNLLLDDEGQSGEAVPPHSHES